jgi:hypothetical protein
MFTTVELISNVSNYNDSDNNQLREQLEQFINTQTANGAQIHQWTIFNRQTIEGSIGYQFDGAGETSTINETVHFIVFRWQSSSEVK